MEDNGSAGWRKSTHSGSNAGNCVETGNGLRSVLVRDTTDRFGAMLSIPARSWREFTSTLKE
jgi:hypothetical protein